MSERIKIGDLVYVKGHMFNVMTVVHSYTSSTGEGASRSLSLLYFDREAKPYELEVHENAVQKVQP